MKFVNNTKLGYLDFYGSYKYNIKYINDIYTLIDSCKYCYLFKYNDVITKINKNKTKIHYSGKCILFKTKLQTQIFVFDLGKLFIFNSTDYAVNLHFKENKNIINFNNAYYNIKTMNIIKTDIDFISDTKPQNKEKYSDRYVISIIDNEYNVYDINTNNILFISEFPVKFLTNNTIVTKEGLYLL